MQRIFKTIPLVIFIFIFSCNNNSINNNIELSEKLNALTEYHIQNNLKLTIKLDTITDFEWENFFVLPPYSRIEDVEKELNLDLNDLYKTNIEHLDGICVLVFIKNNQLISYCEHPRWVDFSQINKEEKIKLFTPETAIFKLENKDVGHYVFVEV